MLEVFEFVRVSRLTRKDFSHHLRGFRYDRTKLKNETNKNCTFISHNRVKDARYYKQQSYPLGGKKINKLILSTSLIHFLINIFLRLLDDFWGIFITLRYRIYPTPVIDVSFRRKYKIS